MTDLHIKFVPPEIIGKRMKEREHITISNFQPWQYGVLRYDGHSFSKFTSGFRQPFDENMKNAMQRTLSDTIDKFNPTCGYVQSDEISLVYSPLYNSKSDYDNDANKKTHIFGGKNDKLVSVIAGYISVRFNYHIINLIKGHESEYKESFIDLINSCQQHFDGRLLVFEANELEEVLNYFVWRKNDCLRNCVSAFARHNIGPKELMHKKFNEMLNVIDYNSIDSEYKYGVFAKKKKVTKTDIDRKTGEEVEIIRTQVETRVIDINATLEFADIVTKKYWN